MQIPEPASHPPRAPADGPARKPILARATSLFDYASTDDCFSDAGLAAVKLNAEEQLARFLQWLQFTDRGQQPS